MFLIIVVIAQGWDHLSLGDDEVPASGVVAVMLVVYYASYHLSFWDTRKAVSRVLLALGLFWLVFVILAHGNDFMTFLIEGLVVPGPFLLCALLCRWCPRVVGVILLALSIWTIFFFNLISSGDSARLFDKSLLIALIPLPLAIGGVALLTSKFTSPDEASPGSSE